LYPFSESWMSLRARSTSEGTHQRTLSAADSVEVPTWQFWHGGVSEKSKQERWEM
jgi:hypothetical protein